MADNVIDLVASSPPNSGLCFAAAAAAAAGSAQQQSPGINFRDFIELIDSSDEEDNSSQAGRRRRRRQRKRLRAAEDFQKPTRSNPRYKTDPNERFNQKVVVHGTERDSLLSSASRKESLLPPGLSAAEAAVIDIYPDISRAHLKSLLQQNSHQSDLVIIQLVDNPSYPKESIHSVGSPMVKLDGRQWSYDFMAPDAFDASEHPVYCVESRALILNLLPFMNVKALNQLLDKHKHRYAICHELVIAALKSGTQDEMEQFQQVEVAVLEGRLLRPQAQKDALASLTGIAVNQALLRNARKRAFVVVTQPILMEEKEYVDSKWREYSRILHAVMERERHKLEADQAGIGLECTCCYDTYALEDMVGCMENGHLCCVGCLDRFASNKMWGDGSFGVDKEKKPLLDLLCFYGGDGGCISCFDRDSLVKALDTKNLKKYDELQCQLVVGQVFGDDLVSCPKCSYQAALPKGQKIFSCPVEGCGFESCRECGEAAHIPLRCDEVEKEVKAKGRLTVEEAITQAKIRRCPNPRCKQPFVKSDGCNKVACSCGTLVCYICREAIKTYAHFCQTPHCQHKSCNKCPLWTKAEEDDVQAMREAGLKAASQVASTAAGVSINVEEILKAGTMQTG